MSARGGCLCGAVRYAVTGPLRGHAHYCEVAGPGERHPGQLPES
jgi:hypothetical protein